MLTRNITKAIGILIALLFILGSFVPTVQATRDNPVHLLYGKYAVGDEVIELRTETSKTYWRGGVRYSVKICGEAIHYKDNYADSSEQWKDIDLTFVNNQIIKAPYILTVNPDNYSLTMYDKKTGSTASLALSTIGGKSVAKIAKQVSKGKMAFSNVATDLDIEIVASNTKVQFKRILKSGKAPADAVFGLSQSGTGITVTSEARYTDSKGMLDAEIPVIATKNGGLLTETIDKAKITKYPVEIDPTLTIQPSGKDNFMYQDAATTNYGTDAFVQVYAGTAAAQRALVEFPITWGADIPAGATITAATFSMYHMLSGGAEGRTYWAYRLLRLDWHETQSTWNIYKTGSNWTTAGCGSDGNDYTTTGGASTTVPAVNNWMNWSVLAQVQTAQTGSLQIAFMIKDGTENSAVYTRFYPREEAVQTTLRPKLVIEYTVSGAPTVTTLTPTNVEETTLTLNANITADCGANANVRGFTWSTTSNTTSPATTQYPPAGYTSNWSENGNFAVGTFSSTGNITGLSAGTCYYYRAYAHCLFSANYTAGWGWSSEASTLTKPVEPNTPTCTPGDAQISLTWNKGTGAAYTYIRYKAGSYPSNQTDGTLSYNGTGTNTTQGGLANGTPYYFVIWSWVSGCTTPAQLTQFSDLTANTTCTPVLLPTPIVLTKACTGFGIDWAIVNGEIVEDAGMALSVIGFDYGTTSSYGSSTTTAGAYSEGATFSSILSPLNPATVYHYRAKVYSGTTWYYGEDMMLATKGSPIPYEVFTIAATHNSPAIQSANWTYQTFTTNTTDIAHSITSIWLYLHRTGYPGTVTVGIQHTANLTTAPCILAPTGDDIITGYFDGDTFSANYTWYKLDVTEKCLSANITYAIVVRAQAGNAASYISWGSVNPGTYSGGNAGNSTNSGVTWTADCNTDMLFQIWGNPCFSVEDAKVFTSYLQSNDWLVTLLYKNIYEPYYSNGSDVASYFYIQLYSIDGSTLLAQTKCPAYGYRPGCIYLNASQVTSLEWGAAYRVRAYGNFGTYPYTEYVLQPVDWMGADLNRLDSWVMGTATLIENYYNTTLTISIANKGLVLNEDGGVIFDSGIPALSSVRPGIFQIVSTTPGYTQEDFTGELQTEHVWQTLLGPFITSLFTGWGNMWNISGSTIGAFIAFAFYAVVAMFAFPIGSAVAAISIPFSILLLAWYTGLIPMAALGIILALAAFLFLWQFVLKGG